LRIDAFKAIIADMLKTNANVERASLEDMAMLSMEVGRLLMESGASARIVDDYVARTARGLGAERIDLRVGYASLAITIGIGGEGITRMRKVGHLGVNQRLDQALRKLSYRVERGELGVSGIRAELERLPRETPRHPGWLVDIAVGVACASFGRLLGVDWLGVGPIFAGATIAQSFRRRMVARHVNVFINAVMVAAIASLLGGWGARRLGSSTVDIAMISSVLLLVPGIPSLNAQNDILEGRPTLGSARAVTVLIILIFLTAGLWLSQIILGEGN
jgi:uncharacterized membrane protein YjjP (DUF1212 family)